MTTRLARFDGGKTGLVLGAAASSVLDVAVAIANLADERPAEAERLRSVLPTGQVSWELLIRRWPEVSSVLALIEGSASASSPGVRDIDTVRLDAPLPSREHRIFAAGGNFADHVAGALTTFGQPTTTAEFARRAQDGKRAGTPPWGFFVLPDLVSGPGASVVRPVGTKCLDYEGEVAAVIGRGGRDLRTADVRFWAVAPFQDFSIRDDQEGLAMIDKGHYTWALSKNFESGKACGPWLTIGDDLDVNSLRVQCRVNGALRQDFTTGEMLYSFAEIAAFISKFIELRPGDIITCGTAAGTAMDTPSNPYLRAGDAVEVEVTGVGTLKNAVAR